MYSEMKPDMFCKLGVTNGLSSVHLQMSQMPFGFQTTWNAC